MSTRLYARRSEPERATLTRFYAVADPSEADSQYLDGLRSAAAAAIDYGLAAIEGGGERSSPLPTPLLAQARLVARNRVGLDTVLRRYVAGHALFSNLLIEEAERSSPERQDLTRRPRLGLRPPPRRNR